MKRSAKEIALMKRRMRQDIAKHRSWHTGPEAPDPAACGCQKGTFRKKRPFGCYKGKGCICRMGDWEPTAAMQRAEIDRREQGDEG
jgi:hypothetical protein